MKILLSLFLICIFILGMIFFEGIRIRTKIKFIRKRLNKIPGLNEENENIYEFMSKYHLGFNGSPDSSFFSVVYKYNNSIPLKIYFFVGFHGKSPVFYSIFSFEFNLLTNYVLYLTKNRFENERYIPGLNKIRNNFNKEILKSYIIKTNNHDLTQRIFDDRLINLLSNDLAKYLEIQMLNNSNIIYCYRFNISKKFKQYLNFIIDLNNLFNENLKAIIMQGT